MKEIVKQVREDFDIARNEAELIVASLLERPRFEIYMNTEVNNNTLAVLKMKLMQLRKGIPIEYITKKAHFLNYVLRIYPGVFIPRLETEYFIELIQKLPNFNPQKILEIGTGSGAIAIALAHVFPNAHIVATDVSSSALDCASENREKYGLRKQIHLLQCSMFDGILTNFDLIVTNPPYIPHSRLKYLPKSVTDFEPIVAINGGKKGVQFITKLIQEGIQYLNPGGIMAIEIDESEVKILQIFLKRNIVQSFIFNKDLFSRIRYLFIGNIKNEECKNNS